MLYGGWSIVRDEILGAFARCKDIEFLTLVNLLDNYIPLVLCIYSAVFKNQMVDLYYDSMLRCWLMFLMFRRRHYDKALLIALSNMAYFKHINHPIIKSLSSSLSAFDEHPVENFHSLLRARTRSHENASKVRQVAREIDARMHELHEFQSTFVPIKKSGFSARKIKSLKLRSAEFLTEKFGMIMSNPGQAQLLTKIQNAKKEKMEKAKKKRVMLQGGGYPVCLGQKQL